MRLPFVTWWAGFHSETKAHIKLSGPSCSQRYQTTIFPSEEARCMSHDNGPATKPLMLTGILSLHQESSTPPVDLQPHGWRDSPAIWRLPSPYPSLLNLLFSLGTLLSLQLIRGKGGNSSTDIKSEFKIWLSPNTHTQSKISFSPGYPFIHIHPGEWQAGLPHRVDKRLQICMYDLAL